MELTVKAAEEIVREVMKVIPYNVNVMDQDGVIIGSGEKSRIGTLHEGASEAIKRGEPVDIFTSGEGIREGVNEPIFVNGDIVGVVGITGPVKEVKPFSQLVRISAALLLEHSATLFNKMEEKRHKEEFLHELLDCKNPYTPSLKERALIYDMDLEKEVRVMVLLSSSPDETERVLKEENYIKRESGRFIVCLQKEADPLIREILKEEGLVKIGLGDSHFSTSMSLEQADKALDTGLKIRPRQSCFYWSDWGLFSELSSMEFTSLCRSRTAKLRERGQKQNLFETLKTFIEENCEIGETAWRLNIHRNTLGYRLDKIQEITGKNPRDILDLMELCVGLL